MRIFNILGIICSTVILLSWDASPRLTDLKTASETNLVSFTIQGNPESTHYHQPIIISLTNISEEELLIKIPIGQQFASVNSDTQDLILVKEELIAMKPKETLKKSLYAMCTQQENSAPGTQDEYLLGGLAEGALQATVKEIQQKEAFNTIGQYAVWSLTDAYGLTNISGFDEIEATHFRNFIANELGVEPPSMDEVENYNEPQENTQELAGHIVGGDFNYGFSKTSNVTIGMFNNRNVIVRELLNSPETPPGKHHFSFQFDTMQYTEGEYFIRLIINGEVKVNYKMRRDG
tara:strand:+ start:116 stop:988 length:873 start_codon:yes stop_codon:yes gene_type:complete